jgi:high-affinity Fe2+/Pb2+ permease
LKKLRNGEPFDDVLDTHHGISLRSIRFNIAWNIWREVAECGVFLIPFFLTGEGIIAIPLSAVIGFLCGALICGLIYYANKHFENKAHLAVFTVALLLLLSTGLFSGGCHNIETVAGSTTVVWTLNGNFWSVKRLPMTLLKPFGYSDQRTVLQIVTFWTWLVFGLILHYVKYKRCRKPPIRSRTTSTTTSSLEADETGINSAKQTDASTKETATTMMASCNSRSHATVQSTSSSMSDSIRMSNMSQNNHHMGIDLEGGQGEAIECEL